MHRFEISAPWTAPHANCFLFRILNTMHINYIHAPLVKHSILIEHEVATFFCISQQSKIFYMIDDYVACMHGNGDHIHVKLAQSIIVNFKYGFGN